MSVAVLGRSDFVTAFEFVGAYGFRIKEGEAEEMVKKLLNDGSFELIILPEEFVKVTSEIRKNLLKRNKIHPVFIFIPGLKGEAKGERLREIRTIVSFASGVELE